MTEIVLVSPRTRSLPNIREFSQIRHTRLAGALSFGNDTVMRELCEWNGGRLESLRMYDSGSSERFPFAGSAS